MIIQGQFNYKLLCDITINATQYYNDDDIILWNILTYRGYGFSVHFYGVTGKFFNFKWSYHIGQKTSEAEPYCYYFLTYS